MLHFSTQPSMLYRRERIYRSVSQGEKAEPARTIVATSSFSSPSIEWKRSLLSDQKPFGEVFYAANIGRSAGLAALGSSMKILNEFQKYEERLQKAEDPREVEEFDWDAAIRHNLPQFYYLFARYHASFVLRKLYEAWAVSNLSLKIADRLTKDVWKSLQRKLVRYPRWTACTRVFHTALWSNSLMYVSTFSMDLLERLLNDLRYWMNKKSRDAVDVNLVCNYLVNLSSFMARKAIVCALAWTASAVGYSVGSYVHTKNGGTTGAIFAEVLVGGLVGGLAAN